MSSIVRRKLDSQLGKSLLFLLIFFAIIALAYSAGAIEIQNPIQAKSFTELIKQIAKAVRTIAVPLAVVAIIFVGFKFVVSSAGGNAKGLEEARKMFIWVMVGTAIIVGASALAEAIVDFAQKL